MFNIFKIAYRYQMEVKTIRVALFQMNAAERIWWIAHVHTYTWDTANHPIKIM